MKSRNRDTDIENKHIDTKGEGVDRMNWETGIDIHTHIYTNSHTDESNLVFTKLIWKVKRKLGFLLIL